MNKKNIITKSFFSLTITFVIIFLSNIINPAYAQTNVCDPDMTVFESVKNALKKVDIRITTVNMMTSLVTDGSSIPLFGGTYAEMMACHAYISEELGDPNLFAGIEGLSDCHPPEDGFCESLAKTYQETGTGMVRPVEGRVSGSLFGMARSLEPGLEAPPVVNLAYFGTRQVAKMPFGEGVLAQVDPSAFSGPEPLLRAVYNIWEAFRNLAFGILGIIMVVVGIMIMNRKKINPQSVVTLQYAIPRIVIAIVLITFSYVIGAGISSIGYTLSGSAPEIVRSLSISGSSWGGTGGLVINTGIVVLISALIVMLGSPVGWASLVIAVFAFFIVLVLWLAALVKWYITYFKLLIEIIVAPLKFTFGAIPGQEHLTTDWFKKVIALTLGMFAIRLTITLTWVVTVSIIGSIGQTGGGIALLAIVGPMLAFFLMAYGFTQARKMPDMIEAAILGEKKR